MEVSLNFEKFETQKVNEKLVLKDFVSKNIDSLRYQLINRDYTLKLNNNKLAKALYFLDLGTLISQFHGNRIEISLPSEKEINELKDTIKTQEKMLDDIYEEKKKIEQKVKEILPADKLSSKLRTLILPIKDSEHYTQIKQKIYRLLTISGDKGTEELKKLKETDFEPLSKNEYVLFYNKIIDHHLKDVHDFIYKFSIFTLHDQTKILELSKIYKSTVLEFIISINEDLLNDFENYFKGYEKFEQVLEYLNNLTKFISKPASYYRVIKHQFPIEFKNLKSENPINLKFSESTFKEITELLSSFPTFEESKKITIEKDLIEQYYFLAFRRDLTVFQMFKVKIEDYVLGNLIFEKN